LPCLIPVSWSLPTGGVGFSDRDGRRLYRFRVRVDRRLQALPARAASHTIPAPSPRYRRVLSGPRAEPLSDWPYPPNLPAVSWRRRGGCLSLWAFCNHGCGDVAAARGSPSIAVRRLAVQLRWRSLAVHGVEFPRITNGFLTASLSGGALAFPRAGRCCQACWSGASP